MRPAVLLGVLFVSLSMVAPAGVGAQNSGNAWLDNAIGPMELNVNYVHIEQVANAPGGSGAGDRLANPTTLMEAAYTSESGLEAYHFSGGPSATIDHTVVYCDGSGNYPHTISFAFAWQPCGHGVILPPLPALLGTLVDHNDISIEVPFSGCFLLTVGVDGFDPGSWDWLVMANYNGPGPINPLAPTTDTFGGSKNTMALYDSAADGIGEGPSCARPWCFEVTP